MCMCTVHVCKGVCVSLGAYTQYNYASKKLACLPCLFSPDRLVIQSIVSHASEFPRDKGQRII